LHALLPTAFELTRLPVAANLLVSTTTHSITHLLAISSFLVISFIPDVFCLQKYKGIWICITILTRALGGNYVNFGVFELYGDPALKVSASAVQGTSLKPCGRCVQRLERLHCVHCRSVPVHSRL
jgi:hypothetical protein